jgi:hypothetical protein
MSYNLDDQPETFEFTLGRHAYAMKYPNTGEIQAIADRSTEMKDLQTKLLADPESKTLPDQIATAVAAQETVLYDLISPTEDGAPSIADALKDARFNTLRAFRQMIQKELSLED